MAQRGVATFTLDYGKCPPWLFERMVKLGREMTQVLVEEYGPDEFIKRIAHPVWFQALGTVLAFDWNASGLTTILTAALKEAIRGQEKQLGIFICGGKGKTSRKTPDEISNWGQRLGLPTAQVKGLVYNSRLSAKVDSSLVQDGFQIYHHAFFFSKNGDWTVVQQGMNTKNQTARRYHWHDVLGIKESKNQGIKDKGNRDSSTRGGVESPLDSSIPGHFDNLNIDFVNEPHEGIASQIVMEKVLNMTAGDSAKTRDLSVDLISEGYNTLLSDLELLDKHSSSLSRMVDIKKQDERLTLLELSDENFIHHPVEKEDHYTSPYLRKILGKISQNQPQDYESLLAMEGVGPKTIRALALVSEVIYGAKPSYRDPARYSFAHGGKDAIPYPVDRDTYDQTIETLSGAVKRTHINTIEKDKILKRLGSPQG